MKIIDINKKLREVKNIKKIVHIVKDKDGNDVKENYVEVVIIARNRKKNWREWYPLEKFKKLNPKVKI
jgi:hypothetical protein